MTALPLTVERVQQDLVCVAPHGDLDVATAYRFDEEVRSIQECTPASTLVVDLRDVAFIDSAGLGRLAAVARRARRSGRRVFFVRGSRTVTRLIALTGLSAGIRWVRRPEDAVVLAHEAPA
jgi:anti-anti-sigma factor